MNTHYFILKNKTQEIYNYKTHTQRGKEKGDPIIRVFSAGHTHTQVYNT